jgi:hypothetical protein
MRTREYEPWPNLSSMARLFVETVVRECLCPTCVAVMVFMTACAQAAETTVITLTCDGKKTDAKASEAKPEPVEKIGLVVNLGERTVSGFAGIVARIAKVDAAHISFGSTVKRSLLSFRSEPAASVTVMGDIDRVTGAVSATIMTTATASSYDLICKPTSRLF